MSVFFQPPPPWEGIGSEFWVNEVSKYLLPGKIQDAIDLSADFSITAADDTWEYVTGLELTLPEIGTYLISVHAHVHVDVKAGAGSVSLALYDDTIVTNSERKVGSAVGPSEHHFGPAFTIGYHCTVRNQVIKVYTKSNLEGGGAPSFNVRDIESDDTGRTGMEYFYYGKLKEVL